MKNFNLFLIAFFSLMVAAGCSENEESVGIEEPQPIDGHTLVFYIMGNGTGLTDSMDLNLLTLRGIANEVISESNHIVIFYDRGNTTRLTEIIKENGRIKEKLIMEYVPTDNCVDVQFMADVFKLIDETYHSNSYGVVFSSHGGGWASPDVFNGYIDETFPTTQSGEVASPMFCGQDGLVYMETPDMAAALEMSGVHFDYILFDACFMSSIEALYDLRHCTDYIIASPCEVLASGFPYTQIIPMLFTEGHMLQGVCEAYIDSYLAKSGNDQSAVVALTDCSKLDELANQVSHINTYGLHPGIDRVDIQGYEGFLYHLFFDLEHYCDLRTEGKLTDGFKAALKAAIPYSAHTDNFFSAYAPTVIPITHSCGVSCFAWIPESAASTKANKEYKQTAWAKATNR